MFHLIKMVLMAFFALGVGYLVCVGAAKEKGLVKAIGYLIGLVLVIGSLFVVGVKLYKCGNYEKFKDKMACHRMGPQQMVKGANTMMPPTK